MGDLLFGHPLFIFVVIYGCQLRDVTMQSEALFGPQRKSINNNAPQLFSKENSTNFCSRSREIRVKSFSNFARQINVTPVEV